MTKTILILGASYAGLTVAHTLLKKTFTSVKDYKVVLVSPTTHFYLNLASVRAIVPGQIPDEKIFGEIASGFKHYPKSSFQFILGTASRLDPTTKSVSISTSTGEMKQEYDILVLATGSRYIGDAAPWKSSLKGYETTKELLHKTQGQVKAARSIVVGGAGPTGVESAAELGFEYGKTKDITLITAGNELLIGSLPANIAKGAEKQLRGMNIKVIKGTKVTDATITAEGKTELKLSDGSKKTVDLYLPTVGVVPNSDYIPKTLLNEKGEVKVDDFLRVKDVENVWAAGDIIDLEPSQIIYAEKQATALVKNLDLQLKGKDLVAYTYGGSRMLGLSLGRSKATGANGNMKLPSIMIWYFKGRTLGTENLPKYITGSKF